MSNFYNYNSLYYFFASIGTLALLIGFVALVLVVLFIVAEWKLFKKAGKHGWESLIPFYSSWVLTEIAGLNWWWFLFLIIDVAFKFNYGHFSLSLDIASFIGSFNCYYNIARRFGKDKTTSIFAGIFPFIFIFIFSLSKKEIYDDKIPVSDNGIFGKIDDNISNNNDNSNNYYNYENRYDDEESTEVVDNKKNDDSNNDILVDNKKNVSTSSFCGNCGTKLNKNMNFCPNCGKKKV